MILRNGSAFPPMPRGGGRSDHSDMAQSTQILMAHLTLGQVLPSLTAGVAASLMVRLGAAEKQLVVRARPKCAACGRRRTRRGCGCSP